MGGPEHSQLFKPTGSTRKILLIFFFHLKNCGHGAAVLQNNAEYVYKVKTVYTYHYIQIVYNRHGLSDFLRYIRFSILDNG